MLARAETRDLVNMTIAHLPEQYRTALARKYVDGQSLEDLAADLARRSVARRRPRELPPGG